ncbi:MAG TPA: hypothetical protein VIY48_10355 [Candidatus Paceibacterota bacterium]
MTKPTATELHQISGVFFYDEDGEVRHIKREHTMLSTFGAVPETHVLSASCWCQPELIYEDAGGYELWAHNGEN